MKRLALGARHLGKLFGLAKNAHRLVGDLLAERGEADQAAGPLDERHAEQRLELAKPRGERRLGDEAGVGGLAEMAVAPKRDEILELLQAGQVDRHLIDKSNH